LNNLTCIGRIKTTSASGVLESSSNYLATLKILRDRKPELSTHLPLLQ